MHVILVLPNLLDAASATLAAADAPALARLLSMDTAPVVEFDGPLAIACAALGIAKQDDWPVAPWLARAAGIDPGRRYWLLAEPVTLEIGRDEGRLAGTVADLVADESTALLSSLREHFASDGIEFVERAPGAWWVAFADPQHLVSSSPDAALGKPLIQHLLRGTDAARWRRWQSEMQMLLFEHPVNRMRESGGRSPVNYVWLWGGGTLRDAHSAAPGISMVTHAPLVRDLARAVGAGARALPASFTSMRIDPEAASTLIWLDGFQAPALAEQLAAFDADWAAPLGRALDHRELDATVVIAGSRAALSFAPRASTAIQRFRRRWSPLPGLPALLAAHGNT